MSSENPDETSVDAATGSAPATSGRRVALDRATVVEAALVIVDDEGLDGLTMRKLGRKLGVEAMSIYHHVKDKDTLLDALVERVYTEIELGELPDEWPDRLGRYCTALRTALMRHPNVLPAVATRPVMSTSTMGLVEVSLTELTEVGLDAETAQRVLAVIVSFIMGHVLSEAGARPELGGHPPEAIDGFRSALGSDQFPLVVASLGGLAPDREAEFDLGVRFLIEGIRAELGNVVARAD